MTNRHLWRTLAAVILLSSTVAVSEACASSSGRAYVRVGPPAPIIETRLVSPGPGHIWIAGFQRWNGSRYVWVPGYWAQPPRARASWAPGRWVHARRGWYFVDGHWR